MVECLRGLVRRHDRSNEGHCSWARYGFTDNQPKTLEEIGKKFSVTRERIRQIEKTALNKLGNKTIQEYLFDN